MDLHTVNEIVQPRSRATLPRFCAGDAFLAGGTWLYSEPQVTLRRLIDLTTLGWPDLECSAAGLTVGATCTLAALERYETPAAWRATPVIGQCCRALLGSFKIRRFATVGGNLCLALPASPMAALAVALQAICTIWTPGGSTRLVPATELITGAQSTVLREGEVLRSVLLSDAALRRRAAFRQMSLTSLGRSAALLIGTRDGERIDLTITASVAQPVRVSFAVPPTAPILVGAIDAAVPVWFDDLHGRPAWRRRVTHLMATEICAELMTA